MEKNKNKAATLYFYPHGFNNFRKIGYDLDVQSYSYGFKCASEMIREGNDYCSTNPCFLNNLRFVNKDTGKRNIYFVVGDIVRSLYEVDPNIRSSKNIEKMYLSDCFSYEIDKIAKGLLGV